MNFCYNFIFILTIFVVFILNDSGCTTHGIKCFVCRSDQDPKCGDPFDNSTVPILNCKSTDPFLQADLPGMKATMCRKINQKVNNQIITIRSCNWQKEGNSDQCAPDPASLPILGGKIEYCSTCSDDVCNSAETLRVTLRGLGPLLIAVFVTRHFIKHLTN